MFGLWQARAVGGYARVNEPGAVCWNEVHTTDPARAREFYRRVFGYVYESIGDPEFPYSTAKLHADDEIPVAGVFAPPGGLPDGVSAYWLTWFGTADTDATVAAVVDRGGSVLLEAEESPFGRSAVVAGPQGEAFGVISVPA